MMQRDMLGGPLVERPVALAGGRHASKYLHEGSIKEKDTAFSDYFWSMPRNRISGVREAMIDIIQRSAQQGFIGSFVDETGMSDRDHAKLSAYRVLADVMGYTVGQYLFHRTSGNVTAPILRRTP